MPQSLPIHIFIADDDADDRLLLQDAFLEGGHTTRLSFFCNGDALLQGIDEARRRHALPHLILLDLNMPGKSGREVLTELKSETDIRRIPVIILTTSRDEDDISLCYDEGASSYIVKPVSFDGLLEITRSLKQYWTETSVLPGQSQSHV